MELSEFAGRHTLSGAEPGYKDDEMCLTFILDGETFTAVEDPSDGYRNHLRDISVGGECKNTFEGEAVDIEYLPDGSKQYHDFDGIVVTVIATGQVVLRVGTDNYNDYYPSCILEFNPQALAANQGR